MKIKFVSEEEIQDIIVVSHFAMAIQNKMKMCPSTDFQVSRAEEHGGLQKSGVTRDHTSR